MRLIDADALKEGLKEKMYGHPFERTFLSGVVDSEPTIDAIHVVRCRECKWWQEDDDIGHCDNPDGLDNYAKPEDFCSYGERKGGADNG